MIELAQKSKYNILPIKIELRHSYDDALARLIGSYDENKNFHVAFMPEETDEAIYFQRVSQHPKSRIHILEFNPTQKVSAPERADKAERVRKLHDGYSFHYQLLSRFLANSKFQFIGVHADFTQTFNQESVTCIRSLVEKSAPQALFKFTHTKSSRGSATNAANVVPLMMEVEGLFGEQWNKVAQSLIKYCTTPSFYVWLVFLIECKKRNHGFRISTPIVEYFQKELACSTMEVVQVEMLNEKFSFETSLQSIISASSKMVVYK